MSGSRRTHRRRRTGSTSRRYKSSELVPIDSHRRRPGPEIWLAGAGVTLVCVLLTTLIWIVAHRAIADQQAQIRERSEQQVIGSAAIPAEEVRHELQLIDQSLAVIQQAWKADSAGVNLPEWKDRLPALMSVASDIFIADDRRIIRQDIIPAAIGQGVGAAYVNTTRGALETFAADGTRTPQGRANTGLGTDPVEGRQFIMYVVRPLDHPLNWIVGASYRSDELTRLYARTNLGANGLAAMYDMRHGAVQAIVGPGARRPKTDAAKSPFYEAMKKADSGLWTGPSSVDGVERIHAFQKIADRDIAVAVGAAYAQVMAPADDLASSTRSVAWAASIVVVVAGGMLVWVIYTLRTAKRRERAFQRTENNVLVAQADLMNARSHLQTTSSQLKVLMAGTSDGILLIDPELRVTAWNHRFAEACGLDPDAVKEGLPLDELIRLQAHAGLFRPLDDLEAEVARRLTHLLDDSGAAPLPQTGPLGGTIGLHSHPMGDGGMILILDGLDLWRTANPRDLGRAESEAENSAAAKVPAAPFEW
jgi:PAS domain-containing protein